MEEKIIILKDEIIKIYSISFDDEDELLDEYEELVEKLIEDYGWENVFNECYDYLINNCKTYDEVIKFANLYWCYGGYEHSCNKPLEFVSYLFYRTNNLYTHESITILDSIASTVFELGNIKTIEELYDYIPITDPLVIEHIKKWEKKYD